MIEDWETGQLFWNSLRRHDGNEKKACEDVRKKYFDDFAKTKNLHFLLGTTQVHHFRSRNPFVIIGTFHPKPITQFKLFQAKNHPYDHATRRQVKAWPSPGVHL